MQDQRGAQDVGQWLRLKGGQGLEGTWGGTGAWNAGTRLTPLMNRSTGAIIMIPEIPWSTRQEDLCVSLIDSARAVCCLASSSSAIRGTGVRKGGLCGPPKIPANLVNPPNNIDSLGCSDASRQGWSQGSAQLHFEGIIRLCLAWHNSARYLAGDWDWDYDRLIQWGPQPVCPPASSMVNSPHVTWAHHPTIPIGFFHVAITHLYPLNPYNTPHIIMIGVSENGVYPETVHFYSKNNNKPWDLGRYCVFRQTHPYT